MASLQDLPQELFDKVAEHVSRRDYKHLRLTSRNLAANALPALAREVHLSPQPLSWRNLEKLASKPEFANHVEGLVLFPNLLPNFDGYAGWMKCVDVRAVRSRYMQSDNGQARPVSEALYRAYRDYQQARKTQQELVAKLPELLPLLLKSFPKLRRLASPMWNQCWRWTPEVEHFGGEVCEFDDFWHWLRPEDLDYNPPLTDKPWRPGLASASPSDVYNSSVLEAGLLGAMLLLPLLDPMAQDSSGYSELNLSMCIDAYDNHDESQFVRPRYPHDVHDQQSDEGLYEKAWESCDRLLRTAKIPHLKTLTLHFQDGCDDGVKWTVTDGLASLITTATSLTELNYRFEAGNDDGSFDLLGCFSHFYAPQLKSLSLSSGFGMFASQHSIEQILRQHANTLQFLSLDHVWFGAEDQSSWSELLQKLPSIVTLQEIQLGTLYDTKETSHRGEFGRDTGYYFQVQGSPGNEAMCRYIVDDGPWPGWSEEIYV